ncbi:FLAP-like endonuclease XPG [Indivirus ILV1]|uniref:FLAP-like endonuclease XPG n=1 Tax=Indivirus ILV1 TaxID=1977633 RepID=A0A1V0SD43_9VIRU|nr:FLAP-like endonuclease XPG [Indivirus ILV1]
MGVKRLFQIVKFCANECISEKRFTEYRGTVQAIDASLLLYKFCIALMNTEHFKKDDGEIIGHIFACFFKTISMLRYGIMPLWIFDGKPPHIKQETIDERRKLKETAISRLSTNNLIDKNEKSKLEKKTFSITSKQINELKKLLDYIGINYIDAPSEAEAQCAAMNISGMCDGVVTEDWDAVLFGCKKMLKDFSNKTNVVEIDVEKLMMELGINQIQLIDLCSILGNDYCSGIGGLKPIDAYLKFKTSNFDMRIFLDILKTENNIKQKYYIPEDFEREWILSRNYYLHAPVLRPNSIIIKWNEPQYDKLYKYLVNEKQLNSDIVKLKINELRIMHKNYIRNNSTLLALNHINNEIVIKKYTYSESQIQQKTKLMVKS